MSHATGCRGYPEWKRREVMDTPGTAKEVSELTGVSERTIREWRNRSLRGQDPLQPLPSHGGRTSRVSPEAIFLLSGQHIWSLE